MLYWIEFKFTLIDDAHKRSGRVDFVYYVIYQIKNDSCKKTKIEIDKQLWDV